MMFPLFSSLYISHVGVCIAENGNFSVGLASFLVSAIITLP